MIGSCCRPSPPGSGRGTVTVSESRVTSPLEIAADYNILSPPGPPAGGDSDAGGGIDRDTGAQAFSGFGLDSDNVCGFFDGLFRRVSRAAASTRRCCSESSCCSELNVSGTKVTVDSDIRRSGFLFKFLSGSLSCQWVLEPHTL
jgi:hypothetical protein